MSTAAERDDQTTSSITVVGAGTVGLNLATAFQRAGHRVRFAARDPASDKVMAAVESLGVDVVALEVATTGADMVVLAVPFAAVADAVRALGECEDVVLVDATNTVGEALPAGAATVVDLIAEVNPDVAIVKAFNTIGAEAFTAPEVGGQPLFLPIAGDAPGVDRVRSLAADIGFDAVIVGDRTCARLLENFAELWIHLAFRTGLGRDFGFARLERTTGR